MAAGLILSQRIVSLAPPPATPDLLFTDFSSGTISPMITDGNVGSATVIDDPTGAGKGKVLRMRYPGGSNDENRWVTPTTMAAWPQHFFFAGDLYIASSTPNITNGAFQRKLLYFRNSDADWGGLVFHLWGRELNVEWVNGIDDINGSLLADGNILLDAWNRVEVEVKINSAGGTSDGLFRGWLNGVKLFEQLNWRAHTGGNAAFYYTELGVGYQVEGGSGWSEDRYWDRVGFASSRIGP